MKIVFLAREAARAGLAGGIATYTWMMARALADQGHLITIVAEQPPEPLPIPDHPRVTVRWIQPLPLCRTVPRNGLQIIYRNTVYSLAVARVLRAIAARGEIDIIESPEWRSEGLAYSYWQATAPIVMRLHTPRFVERTMNGRRWSVGDAAVEWAEALLAHRVARITAPSASLAALAASTWQLPLADIAVIPNPIDTDFFRPACDCPDAPACRADQQRVGGMQAARRASAAQDGSGQVILYVGRLEQRKGVDLLVEALPAVVAAYPQVRLEFVGADTPVSGNAYGPYATMSAALAARAATLGVADQVIFHGKLEPAAVRDHYWRATVCVIPSRYEGFGYTCLEAMACGRPVVAANTGGLAELLAPGDCGLLVPPDDPVALADALIHVLRRPDEAMRWGQNARRHVERVYAAAAVATRMSQFYEEVITRKQRWLPQTDATL
jgi:glycogen(starch) synthase